MKTLFIFALCIFILPIICIFAACIYDYFIYISRPVSKIYEIRKQQKDFCPISNIPAKLLEYIIMIEDPTFYTNKGFSIEAIKMGINQVITKRTPIRGSAITQQLVKNLYFRFHKKYLRKFAELFLAIYVDRSFGKEKVLELYVNIIYFGNGIYGINNASKFYFNKDIRDLTINQMFILANIICAPNRGNPIQYPKAFLHVRNRRIEYLLNKKDITEDEANLFLSYGEEHLDDELRKEDEFTENFSREIVMINERFGPQLKLSEIGNH